MLEASIVTNEMSYIILLLCLLAVLLPLLCYDLHCSLMDVIGLPHHQFFAFDFRTTCIYLCLQGNQVGAMFKKPPSLGATTVLKNSDRRNLVKELVVRYASITIEECKSHVFPEGLKQCKATTSSGEYCTLFMSGDNPVAFRIGKGDQGALIPTGPSYAPKTSA